MNTGSLRWYFRLSKWQPTHLDLTRVSMIIQPEEKERIAKFHFLRDAKASMVGRLLIRKSLSIMKNLENSSIQLGRDEGKKPFLAEDYEKPCEQIKFNISHSGDFVILATESDGCQVGVDVLDISKPGRASESVDEYFRLMNRQFTENEWKQIKRFGNHSALTNFARFWCLKESYVKAIGIGIVIDLRSIDFSVKEDLEFDKVVTTTTLAVDAKSKPNWKFAEQFLDENHIGCVAKNGPISFTKFQEVSIDYLLNGMNSINPTDEAWCSGILKKVTTL